MPQKVPLISLQNVTFRSGGVDTLINTTWQLKEREIWAVVGPTGSGKTLFLEALAGNVPTSAGEILYAARANGASEIDPPDGMIGMVSPAQHRALASRALDFLQARWSPREGSERFRVLDLLHGYAPNAPRTQIRRALSQTGVAHLIDRDLAALSNGEFRRVLLARALLTRPRVLLLDDPFAGLDTAARAQVNALLRPSMAIVMTVPRRDDLPQTVTHLLALEGGHITYSGPFHHRRFTMATRTPPLKSHQHTAAIAPPTFTVRQKLQRNTTIIDMRGVTVRYGRFTALDNITWRMGVGEKWVLRGPNGAGKTTLTNLILADHPQGYQNEIHLFGQRRGTGESIWDIKARIGWMAPELQYTFPGEVRAMDVVTSGLHDALGLNFRPSRAETARARSWLRFLGVDKLAARPFGGLSDGEQRLILLARALVKQPPLLILDEPSQGLDRPHRALLKRAIAALARIPSLSILLITHLDEDIPPRFTHELRLERGKASEHRRAAIRYQEASTRP